MVLVQLIINNSNNGSYFVIPITGKASLRVTNIQYMDNGGQCNRLLQLQSDILYFPYSPAKYLTWMCHESTSATHATISFDNSKDAYHLVNQQFHGQIQLTVVSLYTSSVAFPLASFYCVVTLNFEEIDMEFK
jgi:hypothetical protein